MYNIKKKSLIFLKNISKNIHIIILILLIFLTCIALYSHFSTKENFIGNKSTTLTDLGDEVQVEKKDYNVFPPKSKYELMNHIFGNQDTSKAGEDTSKAGEDTSKAGEDTSKAGEDASEAGEVKSIPISLPNMQSAGVPELEKSELQKTVSKLDEHKPLLGTCDFYFNKCPNNKSSMATIKGNNLSCGKNNESKKAEAIAQIKNGHISKITIIQSGTGYNYQNPPKVTIESNSGNSATAKAIVDKNGTISSIDIIDYGYGYVETPNINIEPPQMDGVCHLCC
jgi:hypothetical protein